MIVTRKGVLVTDLLAAAILFIGTFILALNIGPYGPLLSLPAGLAFGWTASRAVSRYRNG